MVMSGHACRIWGVWDGTWKERYRHPWYILMNMIWLWRFCIINFVNCNFLDFSFTLILLRRFLFLFFMYDLCYLLFLLFLLLSGFQLWNDFFFFVDNDATANVSAWRCNAIKGWYVFNKKSFDDELLVVSTCNIFWECGELSLFGLLWYCMFLLSYSP